MTDELRCWSALLQASERISAESTSAESCAHDDWRGSPERERDYRILSRSIDIAFGQPPSRREPELQELLASAWISLRSGDEAQALAAMEAFESARDVACEELAEMGGDIVAPHTAEMADFLAEAAR